ncbi:MAG TPA: type II CAAX endopeptidase family protein [Verrucomicrobiae bacterium]|nr:type II CAAX endopeptidase family protein [Verrucomicrobiae bacterium]
MNEMEAAHESKTTGRILPLIIFLVCSLLLFEPPFFAFGSADKWFQIITFVGLPLFFSALAILARQNRRFIAYWPAFCSYLIVSISLLLMWLLDDFPRKWLGFAAKAPSGRAVIKVTDALILLLTVVVLGKLFRIDFDSIYLRKGTRPWVSLIIGVAGFALMAAFAVVEAHGIGIDNRRIFGWLPWILSFVLANGFLEELMFRALFLRKFEPLLGATLANLLTAFVFGVGHAGVTYSTDVVVFAAITFVLALVWGYLIQRTGTLWGAALFHAGADTLIIIGMFAGVKTT